LKDPHALKIPARRAEYLPTESALSPFHAEPAHDRLLLNGLIQPFQQPERVLGFFNAYRNGTRVTRSYLTGIADQFQNWVTNRSEKWGAPILEDPEGSGDDARRDKFVLDYFQNAKPNQVVAILKPVNQPVS
jgi:hypothetical protein